MFKKKTDPLNEEDNVRLQLEEDMAREKASDTVDVENANQAKAKVEREPGGKIFDLEEENRRLATEVAKFKEGYENANKVVVGFVAKGKDAFSNGLCLPRRQVLDRNPQVELSGLNGLERPSRSAEWFSSELLQPQPSDPSSSPKGSAH